MRVPFLMTRPSLLRRVDHTPRAGRTHRPAVGSSRTVLLHGEGARQILAESRSGLPAAPPSMRFRYIRPDVCALIETGSGNYLQPTAGEAMANIKAAGASIGHSGPVGRSATEIMGRCRSFAGRPDRVQRRPAGLAFPYCRACERLPELGLARSFTICESSHP